jgi:hypothetical protein
MHGGAPEVFLSLKLERRHMTVLVQHKTQPKENNKKLQFLVKITFLLFRTDMLF